jgi:hypothetical protein
MVKISIKKGKKTIKPKPRQKQKQKQSQKVIVNIGSSIVSKRRAPTQTLQKKAVNNQTPTPNIIVPQAMPQNSNNEILRYIKESEQQKEMIKKQEKNNELEKDKIKEKKPSVIPAEEKAQVQFTMVNSQNISGISSGLATPTFNPLSTPLNYRSLQNELGKLIQRADLEGENPNTGRISLSTFNPPSSGSSILSDGGYIDDNDSVLSYESRTPLTHTAKQPSLTEYVSNQRIEPEEEEEYIEPETEQKTIINETSQQETETQGEPLETITNEPTQDEAVIIDTPEPEKTAYEQADEAITMIDQALKPKTESKQAEDLTSVIDAKKTKTSESKRAEEPPQMIEIKSVGAPRTPPPYTKDQINKMKVKQIGDIITAEKIKDNGTSLVYDEERGRVFRKGQKGQQINLSDLRPIVLSHYGIADS